MLTARFRRTNPSSPLAEYAIAVLAFALACAVRALLIPAIGERGPYAFFLAAVATVGLWCTVYPTLLTLLLGGIAGTYLFSAPRFSFSHDVTVWSLTAVYFIAGAAIVYVTQQRQRSMRRLEAALAEQQRSDDALRASEQRLELAQQAARIGSWEWDIPSGAITWSHGVPALHGLPTDAMAPSGEEWWQLIHERDRDLVRRALDDALAGRREYDVEFRTPWPDGSVHWVAARGRVLRDRDGAPLRMVGIGMDVTDRKRAEESLRMGERLAATGRMAATLAHEINNPLAAITNLFYLVRSNAGLPQELRPYVDLAEQELARMSHVVRQGLSFYRDEVIPRTVRADELIDDILGLYRRRLEANAVSVTRRYNGVIPVVAVATDLRQLFSNIIINAMEAVAHGGSIAIRITGSEDWSNPRRRGVRVSIADNGPGIARENLRRMFQPFFTTKGSQGTGLGLWISQGIAEKHHGSIRVRSSTRAISSGTCFSVFLPAETAGSAAAEAAGGSAAA